MKKILICLFGLISLGLINFSNAGTYTFTGHVSWIYSSSSIISPYNNIFSTNIFSLNGSGSSSTSLSGHCDISNFSIGNGLSDWYSINSIYPYIVLSARYKQSVSAVGYYGKSYNTNFPSSSLFNSSFTIPFTQNVSRFYNWNDFSFYVPASSSSYSDIDCSLVDCSIFFDYSCVIEGDYIIDFPVSNNNSCDNSGSCTVNDKLSDNLLYTGSVSLNNSSYTNIFNYGTNGAGTYCVKLSSSSPQTLTFGFTNSSTGTPTNLYQLYNDQYGNWVCLYGNKSYFNAKLNSSSNTVSYEVYKLTDLLSYNIPCSEGTGSSCDYSDYILLSDVTKQYCTNKFSDLIPEDDITQGYCETEFSLISPEDCPYGTGEFTGDVMWSSFFVNNRQILGGENIYLTIPDFLDRSYTYVDQNLQVDVENEGDLEYIQNILDIQSYHPDKDQFAMSFAGFLTLLMPYIIITLFIIFVWKLIRRIFR